MIRSSNHLIKWSNTGKKDRYESFLDEWRRVSKLYLDYFWEEGYEVGSLIFDPEQDRWELPKYLDYNVCELETTLSGRALSSLVTQLRGVIDSAIIKHRKRLYVRDSLQAEGKPVAKKLLEKIEKYLPTKPDCSNLNPEVSSKCALFHEMEEGRFCGFLQLKSLGNFGGDIWIPIKDHKVSKKWRDEKGGELKGSFLLRDESVDLRWKVEVEEKKGKTKVGADQGKNTIMTFSDGQTTPDCHCHEHTLDSIMDKMARKKKGSKAFKKASDHRENLINWSINQLNLTQIDSVRLESIWNITYKQKVSRKMSHWTNSLIRDKMSSCCEESGVRFSLQSSAYRSQRCSQCGLVLKSSRSGKTFACESCGLVIDADLNAAKNHEVELPDVPPWLRSKKLNKIGFYWLESGFYERKGEEPGVPLRQNEVAVVDCNDRLFVN